MSMVTAQAYPLTWPETFPRAKQRERSRFQTTLAAALRNVQDSLRKFAIDSGKKLDSLVISSNCALGMERPADPGVAVWFVWDGIQVCIPVDRYQTVAENLQAIHHVIEARRTELRHGTLALVRAAFTGFRALPPPQRQNWRDVLALPADARLDRSAIDAAFKRLASVHHPDRGGTDAQMAELNAARQAALQEIGEKA